VDAPHFVQFGEQFTHRGQELVEFRGHGMTLANLNPDKRRQVAVGLLHIAVGLVLLAVAARMFWELLWA